MPTGARDPSLCVRRGTQVNWVGISHRLPNARIQGRPIGCTVRRDEIATGSRAIRAAAAICVPSQFVPGRLPRLIVNVHPRRYVRIIPFSTKGCDGGCDAVFRFEIYGDE